MATRERRGKRKSDLKKYRTYVNATVLYGLFGIGGLIVAIYAITAVDYFLLSICVLIMIVSWDNFFCAHRARTCGLAVQGEYTIPHLFRKK